MDVASTVLYGGVILAVAADLRAAEVHRVVGLDVQMGSSGGAIAPAAPAAPAAPGSSQCGKAQPVTVLLSNS